MSSIVFISSCANIASYQMTKPIANAKMQSEFVSDIELFYYTLGDENNPPLVFLHGILAFTEAYKRFLTSLSDKFFIIGIDLPGHGRSSIPSIQYNLNDMSDDVIKLTEKLNLDSFYLVGHSMGGLLTLGICEKYPGKIKKAVSIASLYNVRGINFENNKYNFLTAEGFQKNTDHHTNFYLKAFNHSYKRIDEEEKFKKTKTLLENYKEDLYPQISLDQLEKITTPVLIVVAEKDQLIKPEHTKEISTVLENGTLLTFPNANHGSIVVSKRHVKQLSKNITIYFNK